MSIFISFLRVSTKMHQTAQNDYRFQLFRIEEQHRNALECTKTTSFSYLLHVKQQYQNTPECTEMNIDLFKFSGGEGVNLVLVLTGWIGWKPEGSRRNGGVCRITGLPLQSCTSPCTHHVQQPWHPSFSQYWDQGLRRAAILLSARNRMTQGVEFFSVQDAPKLNCSRL